MPIALAAPLDHGAGSSLFPDYGPDKVPITVNGSVSGSAAQSLRSGESSPLFQTTSANHLSLPASASWQRGSGVMSVSFYFFPTAFNSDGGRILTAGGGVTNFNTTDGIQFLIQSRAADFSVQWNVSGAVNATFFSGSLNEWIHLLVEFGTTATTLKINGVVEYDDQPPMTNISTTPQLMMGRLVGEATGGTFVYTGHLQDLLIYKDAAEAYSDAGAFTPPTRIVSTIEVRGPIGRTASVTLTLKNPASGGSAWVSKTGLAVDVSVDRDSAPFYSATGQATNASGELAIAATGCPLATGTQTVWIRITDSDGTAGGVGNDSNAFYAPVSVTVA